MSLSSPKLFKNIRGTWEVQNVDRRMLCRNLATLIFAFALWFLDVSWLACYSSGPAAFCRAETQGRKCQDFWAEKVHSFRLAVADPTMYHTLGEITGAFNGGACCRGKEISPRQSGSPLLICKLNEPRRAARLQDHNTKQTTQTKRFIQKDLEMAPELCQEVLRTWRDSFLDPLLTGALPSPKKYHHILHYVCKDKCEETVHETLENIHKMNQHDVKKNVMPSCHFEESCADRVVDSVKSLAEIPAAAAAAHAAGTTKAAWRRHSLPEMRNWTGSRSATASITFCRTQPGRPCVIQCWLKLDTKVKDGTDVGGSYMGQDPPLVWTRKGLKQFTGQLKKLKAQPKEGDQVRSLFLDRYQRIRQEGLEKRWFKEQIAVQKEGPISGLDPWDPVEIECLRKRPWIGGAPLFND